MAYVYRNVLQFAEIRLLTCSQKSEMVSRCLTCLSMVISHIDEVAIPL